MTPLRLRLPATSANLGPGFDAVGLAMSLFLAVDSAPASHFSIDAHGRNQQRVASLDGNLILDTYRDLLQTPMPLHLQIHNEIPLGMGCGSSAAALLAGVLLANHFGELKLTSRQILEEACRREGHPDNVAACLHGGFTVSSMHAGEITTASHGHNLPWRLLLAIPDLSLATVEARALLPDRYSRSDVVHNIQSTALLVSAFALARPDLLRAGTRDQIHQPFRAKACPLLPALLPLVGHESVYSVSLSGAGPSVLVIAKPETPLDPLLLAIREAACSPELEVLELRIAPGASWHPMSSPEMHPLP